MFVNVSKAPIQVGRFKSIKPGDKIPDVPFTDAEQADIDNFIEKGLLQTVGTVEQPEKTEAPEPVAPVEAIQEETIAEEPVEAPLETSVESTPEATPEESTDVYKMKKHELEKFAADTLGVELDMSKKVSTLRDEVNELINQ